MTLTPVTRNGRFLKSILIGCLLIASAQAKESTIQIYTENLPPYQFIDNLTQEVNGINSDKVKKLMKCTGFSYQLNLFPWVRSYEESLKNKNAMIYPIIQNKRRLDKFHWIKILGYSETNFFKLKSRKDIKINQFSDAKNYHLGLLKNNYFTHLFIDAGFKEGINFSYYYINNNQLPMLFNGHFEIIEENPKVLEYMEKKRFPFSKIEKLILVTKGKPAYLALNKNTDLKVVEKIKECADSVTWSLN